MDALPPSLLDMDDFRGVTGGALPSVRTSMPSTPKTPESSGGIWGSLKSYLWVEEEAAEVCSRVVMLVS